MEPDPPPTIEAKVYEAGEMACLATPASWDAPIVYFKKQTTVLTTLGLLASEVDFIWPAWNEKIDYTSAADPINDKKPRVWLVWHEGTLWYPTLWYSPSHIGIPPTLAASGIGQPAGYRSIQEYENPFSYPPENWKPSELVNRGGEVRVWLRCPPGTEEEYSADFWNIQPALYHQVARYPVNNISDYCDGHLVVVPFHLMPRYDYNQEGQNETHYIPGRSLRGRKIVESQGFDSAGEYTTKHTEPDDVIKIGQQTPFIPTRFEPAGWDSTYGTMQSKIRGAEFNAYYPERGFTSSWGARFGNYRGYFYSNYGYYGYSTYGHVLNSDNGGSYTLWQKIAKTQFSLETKTVSLSSGSWQFLRSHANATITDGSPPTGAMILAHPNPVPGYAGFDINVPGSSWAACDYFQGDAWFAGARLQSTPPYDPVPVNHSSSSSGQTITSTTTSNVDIVSHPVHPAFARRATTVTFFGTTTKATSSGTQTSSTSTVSMTNHITTKTWQNTDANKVLQIYPFNYLFNFTGTPTEVPSRPMSLDSTKVVGSYQDYNYFYQTGWSSQWASFFTTTQIFKPGSYGDASFSHD